MLCVIAKIDDAGRQRLDALCKIAAEFGLPPRPLHGHITLISYLGQDEAAFIARCKAALRSQGAFSVRYEGVGILSPTPSIAALPCKTPELAAVHAHLIEAWPCDLSQWSLREIWRPHTTLFHDETADLPPIAARMQAAFTPFTAEVARIEFSRVTDSGYEIIDAFEL